MAQLNYERRGPPDSSGERTLVLLHGIGSRWQMWEPVFDQLAAGHDVIALDLPGFGASPAPAATPPGAAGLAGAVAEFLSELGVTRPHLVGNSLGGWVALELALRGEARSVTALSPAGFASRPEAIWSQVSLRSVWWLARRIRPGAARLARYGWFRRMAFQQMTSRPGNVTRVDAAESIRALADAPAFAETLDALHRARFRLVRPLEVPVTIAWGERDRLLPYRQAARAAAEVPGARIVKLPGCGHIPTYDDPELVARVILQSLSY